MTIKYAADLHCHPSLKPFRNIPSKSMWETLEEPIDCKLRLGFGRELLTESRTNLIKCQNGKVRILFISLLPIERPIFDLKLLARCVINEIELGRCITNFGEERVQMLCDQVINDEEVKYIDELLEEFEYVRQYHEQNAPGQAFKLAKSYTEAKQLLEDGNTLVGIFTIEGAHAFNHYDNYKDILSISHHDLNKPNHEIYKEFLKRFTKGIQKTKSRMGDFTPFFVNLTHHFWNLLCGHAQSYEPFVASVAIKQRKNANIGLTALGEEVIDLLLSRENGRRILIDTKHMSLLARKRLYEIWEERKNKNDHFPIICSHTAVNGRADFFEDAERFRKRKKRKDKASDKRNRYFNGWSINMYDYEIEIAIRSNGLIGIILHEDRLPGWLPNQEIKLWKERWEDVKIEGESDGFTVSAVEDTLKLLYLRVIVANIFHIVNVGFNVTNEIDSSKTAWDVIGLGTDFDGIINSMECYETMENIPFLANDLKQYLQKVQEGNRKYEIVVKDNSIKDKDRVQFTVEEMQRLMMGLSPQEIVDKIFHQNVENFLEMYYNDNYLKKQPENPSGPLVVDGN